MAGARFLVGIDLGTVNSAIAAVDLAALGDPADALRALAVPQLVAAGLVEERRLLPSSAYVPGPELAPSALRLPWGERPVVVGELAREQGARVPGRLVASAKSWLSNAKVDRTAAILPWGAPEGVPRLSPVAASARYLAHLRDAWDAAHPDAPLAAQEVVLTVPASFDEVARELTLAAAADAGLRPTLLEEPQAAFYDWAARHRADLGAALGGHRLVLVVDVGGGTTDLTLIRAEVRDGRPRLERLAVGDHLLLGGDNVDVALARGVEAKLGERLDAPRWAALVQACRLAKEKLLAEGAPPRLPVAVVGRGSRLVASAVSSELVRDEVRKVLLDGFFPAVAAAERPRRAPRTAGLAELGLPYESDPAITRHVAAFLAEHAADVGKGGGGMPRPDAILVNGGVFTPAEVRERLAAVVSSWFPGQPPVALLASPALDLAVARGAAYAALVRRGLGIRIGGGSPRAYYVGIAGPVPAEEPQALCVVPRHLEEGSRVEVPRTFELALGRPVRFPLWASARPRFERPGDVVPVTDDLAPLPPIATVLRSPDAPAAARGGMPGDVAVRLEAALTEIGTLELWCVAKDRDARWKLEFQLRGAGAPGAGDEASEVAAMPRRFDEARAQIDLFYGKKSAAVEPREVKGLFRALERILGPRDGWSTPVLRELWGALHAGQTRRRRSPDHERIWLQLTGFCLRPGFGAPLDAWRAAETWKIFGEGLQYGAEPHGWQAWWILWRR
ncbi:MAG TPA: Hsp70 family protein, partial [Anaeromyxobacteraceae bacterium]|nr:Hsp70 family protein [Anaeromyxobacteraceae bacterium]